MFANINDLKTLFW